MSLALVFPRTLSALVACGKVAVLLTMAYMLWVTTLISIWWENHCILGSEMIILFNSFSYFSLQPTERITILSTYYYGENQAPFDLFIACTSFICIDTSFNDWIKEQR